MGIKDLIEGRSDTYEVDPATIVKDPEFNVRLPGPDLVRHIRWLADSIKSEGVKEALTCYIGDDSLLHVTNGHCRIDATLIAIAEGADIKTVPVRLEPRYSNAEDRTLSLITRNSGKSLTQIELGTVLKRLLNFGWKTADLSKRTGFTPQHIRNILTVANAPASIIAMVQEGKISPTLVAETIHDEGEERAVTILQQAIKGAKDTGKTKATKRHVEGAKGGDADGEDGSEGPGSGEHGNGKGSTPMKKRGISWKKHGPILRTAVTKLYDVIGDDDELVVTVGTPFLELGILLSELDVLAGPVEDTSKQRQMTIDGM